MKPRRVMVVIEMTTDQRIDDIKEACQPVFCWDAVCDVHQMQCNVIKPEKK